MAHQPMRIGKRELTDPYEIYKILSANHIIRVAFHDEDTGFPYIVPINYGFEYDQQTGSLVFYVHCAQAGRKLNLLDKDNRVGFEIDESWGLRQTETACRWGLNFNSIVGEGRIYRIDDADDEAKRHGLDIIMRSHGRFHDLVYTPASYRCTAILRLEAERFTAKVYRDRTMTSGDAEGVHPHYK